MDRENIIKTLRDMRDDLRAKGIAHMGLYGSVARDEAQAHSDIDLLVTLSRPAPSLIVLSRLKRELATSFDSEVDFTTAPIQNPYLKQEIDRDLVSIF